MASTGVDVKDVLPIPPNTQAITNDQDGETSNTLAEPPTGRFKPHLHQISSRNYRDPTEADWRLGSHALATADHDEKGEAQEQHDDEVKDLGWTETNDKIADPLVARLPNEELWILVRRFNKVRGLDLAERRLH